MVFFICRVIIYYKNDFISRIWSVQCHHFALVFVRTAMINVSARSRRPCGPVYINSSGLRLQSVHSTVPAPTKLSASTTDSSVRTGLQHRCRLSPSHRLTIPRSTHLLSGRIRCYPSNVFYQYMLIHPTTVTLACNIFMQDGY